MSRIVAWPSLLLNQTTKKIRGLRCHSNTTAFISPNAFASLVLLTVFRLAVGWAQLSGADGSEVIAREYVRNGGGGSAKQKLERRVQQRRKGEGRETSLSSSISSVLKAAGFGSTVYGLDVFDESGRRRSARERKQVELENIDHEPPKQRVRRNTV